MFTTNHFIWLVLCALCVVGGLIPAVRCGMREKTASRIMAGICLVSEISKIFSEMQESEYGGMVIDARALPFHLCSMLIFAVLYLNLAPEGKGKDIVRSFLVPVGLLGGVAAMLIPTNGVDFNDIGAYQCFVYHAGLVWYALYLLCTGKVRITGKVFLRNTSILLGLAFIMIWVNGALAMYGTNFMYVRKPPMENLPILNLEHGWYVYFASLLGVGAVLMTLFHVPFLIVGAVRKRKK